MNPAYGETEGNGRRKGRRNFFRGCGLGARCFSLRAGSSGRGASGGRIRSSAEGYVAPALPVVWQGIGGGVRLGRAQGRDVELSGVLWCRMRSRRAGVPLIGFAWILPVRARGGAQAFGGCVGGGLGVGPFSRFGRVCLGRLPRRRTKANPTIRDALL